MRLCSKLLLVVSVLFWSGQVFSQSVDLTTTEWTVFGTDANGTVWDESVLVFTDQTPVGTSGEYEIEGFFDWVSSAGNSGRELFEGVLAADLSLSFEGVQLINTNGIVLSVYLATVTADGNSIVNGSWSNGIPSNDWSALRGINNRCNGLLVDVFIANGDLATPGPDVIMGTAGNDDIRGKAGNDTICGMGGDDFIHGNSGDDWIDGGDGVDNIRGGQGDDTLFAGSGATVGTASRVFGGNGVDAIFGGSDADDLRGGRGDDVISGEQGADLINGNDGDDQLFGGPGADTLNGGGGANDVLFGEGGADTLNGGSGNNDMCDGGGQGSDSEINCET